MIGKMYEIVKTRLVAAFVFDESFSIVDTLESGHTFVVLECLREYIHPDTPPDQSEQKIYQLKILTPTGIIGFSSFAQDEIRAIENA